MKSAGVSLFFDFYQKIIHGKEDAGLLGLAFENHKSLLLFSVYHDKMYTIILDN